MTKFEITVHPPGPNEEYGSVVIEYNNQTITNFALTRYEMMKLADELIKEGKRILTAL